MRLFRAALSSSSELGSAGAATSLLRLPWESLSSKSSVAENQVRGAVTIFLMVPKSEEVERATGCLF